MAKITESIKSLFAKKQKQLDPENIDRLRLDFKERYYNFKLLINANNKALEIMSDIERALGGKRPFGMTFVQ